MLKVQRIFFCETQVSCLETTLRNFSCLTIGDGIMVAYNNKKYYIDIIESKPSNAISIIERDCEVDFAPPLDYKEPERLVAPVPLNKATAQELQCGMSYTWRSILAGRELLRNGLRFQVGRGDTIRLWTDPWLPLPYTFRPFSLPMEGTEDWLVSDLIDLEAKEWMEDIVTELFSPEEAEIITRIPISLRGPHDRYVWHFDRRGCFTVKSCYHAARNTAMSGSVLAASSSTANNLGKYWKILWQSNVPPKVRIFVWRLLKGVVPTMRNLLQRRVPLPDSRCVFCHKVIEDDLHVFKNCKLVVPLWVCSPLTLHSYSHPAHSLMDWIFDMPDKFTAQQRELFFVLLWVIWKNRNCVLWQDGVFHSWSSVCWAVRWLGDYQKVHTTSRRKEKRPRVYWRFPPTGRLKINIDGAFQVDRGKGGIGVVVRDEMGTCMAALARPFSHVSSALQMEAEALRAGLLIAIHQGWTDVVVECDCSVLAAAIARTNDDFSEIGRIVDDCKDYIQTFNSFQLLHIFREANSVANRLAHVASYSFVDEYWVDESPAIIQDVLVEDIAKALVVNRSTGLMSPPRSVVSIV
ncbi:putative ribonuclease H protein At1g65750 isoform X2 [Rosa rugosa]|uniref:putative ribonuclease H protein At1g65750 isoform X2 n=1 Tax=Rosa rugosa TaxID=74645 RepID=UPI002B407E56|nr:putative ribonuclease H protein At1g65750 isoform X2 [Rosa rugosa]